MSIKNFSNFSNDTFGHNRPSSSKHTDISTSQLLLQTIIFAVIQIFGLAGNILVVILVFFDRRLHTNYYLTVLQLSLCDIGLLICSIIEWQVQPWLWYNSSRRPKNFRLSCKFWITGYSWSYTNGVYFMVLIGYLRHRCVVQPFKGKLSRKQNSFSILLVYVTVTLFHVPRFISLDAIHSECLDTFNGILLYNLYTIVLSLLQFLLPMIFLVVLYTKLCFSLYKHSQNIQACNATTQSAVITKSRLAFALQRRNTKAMLTGILIVVIFGTVNLPRQISLFLASIQGNYEGLSKENLWTSALQYIGSACLNPYIYALLDGTISTSFKKKLKRLC